MPRSPRVRSGLAPAGGFTYAEVLLVVLLLSLVVAGILPLLTGGDASYQEVRRRQEMMQNARVALDKLLRELRAAESIRVVSPPMIQMTLFWGDGSGATPTVEYVLNAVTGDLQYRWSADWDYRRQITVTAPAAVPAGYAVRLTFSHSALVTAGKSLAGGDDVRIRYWNGVEMVELDRVLDPLSSWNNASTTLWFRLQTAMAAGSTNNNYYLYYGNAAAGPPPANGDNVFLDYADGTSLGGWTRRDTCAPVPPAGYATSADGFVFTASSGNNCYRWLSRAIANDNVEIFWGFRSGITGDAAANDRHMPGMGARLNATGAGYLATPGYDTNRRWQIREVTSWANGGSIVAHTARDAALYRTTPGVDYYGRFYLVGSTLQLKIWAASTVEPAGWTLSGSDASYASAANYALVDGHDAPQNHIHRRVIVRPRVTSEPTPALGVETAGTRPDALEALAGPFRSVSVTCFSATGAVVPCAPTTPVRSVQVALVVMDPTGLIPDITVTGRTFRQSP